MEDSTFFLIELPMGTFQVNMRMLRETKVLIDCYMDALTNGIEYAEFKEVVENGEGFDTADDKHECGGILGCEDDGRGAGLVAGGNEGGSEGDIGGDEGEGNGSLRCEGGRDAEGIPEEI